MEDRTPQEIVEELDKYIIGQGAAKKAMAIALRNRYRRRLLPPEAREDVAPKNIMMIGATGIGKTEIARRVASMSKAPFVKVEATRFTEVGYVGKDVESIMQDLVEAAVGLLSEQKMQEVQPQAEKLAEERIIEYLLVQAPGERRKISARKGQMLSAVASAKSGATAQEGLREEQGSSSQGEASGPEQLVDRRRRNQLARLLRSQRLNDTVIAVSYTHL